MGGIEREQDNGDKNEILDPHHFYAAYVFDQAEIHQRDFQLLIDNAQGLGYPLRFWWLSDAMDLQGFSDRLIVCVHHPSDSEDAGMDLYNVLKETGVSYDDLDAAVVEEYTDYGRQIKTLDDLCYPEGNKVFPGTKPAIDNHC
jgi:hypothetical protein